MKEKNTLHCLREQRGLTQEEVAEELGVSRQSCPSGNPGRRSLR
jgi:DNA-binding XRE family transcriptional regulator